MFGEARGVSSSFGQRPGGGTEMTRWSLWATSRLPVSQAICLPLDSEEWGLGGHIKGSMDQEPCHPKPMCGWTPMQKEADTSKQGKESPCVAWEGWFVFT